MSGATAASLGSLFPERKFLKFNGGQALPEIPLSVGSKLEARRATSRSFCLCQISPYTHAFVRVYHMHITVYVRTRCILLHDIGAEGYAL